MRSTVSGSCASRIRDAPSVIVLDYMMPRCSGPQFRQRQLADPEIADVPVILVSAVSDLSSRAALLKPYAMLQKPIDPDQLTSVVREACNAAPQPSGLPG